MERNFHMYPIGSPNAHQGELEDGGSLNFYMFGGDSDESPSPSPEESGSSDPPSPVSPPPPEEDSMDQPPPEPDDMGADMSLSILYSHLIPALRSGKHLLIECPPGMDRKSSVVKVILNYWQWVKRGMPLYHHVESISPELSPLVPEKIYIACRNFKETKRFMGEIKEKLRFTNLLENIKISVLDHRENMCLNQDVMERNQDRPRQQGYEVDHACRGRIRGFDPTHRNSPSTSKKVRQDVGPMCEYYHTHLQNPEVGFSYVLRMPEDAAFHQGHEIHDIEDFKENCLQTTRCPYYDSRRLAQDAHLIFCPVDILLSPSRRAEYNIDLTRAIVLIDDGFDIENLCKNEAILNMTMEELNSACALLRVVTDDYQRRDQESGDIGLDELVNFLSTFVTWARDNSRADRNEILDFIESSPTGRMNILSIERELLEYAHSFANVMTTADAGSLEMLRKFVTTFDLLKNAPNSFTVKFTTQEGPPESNRSHVVFQIICADPSLILQPIAKNASSLIVAANCIAPYDPFETEFGITFQPPVKIPTDPALNDRLHVVYTNRGVDGTIFGLNFDNRDEPPVKKTVGLSLIRISQTIPRGKLALFHSEDYLKRILRFWRQTRIAENEMTIMQALQAVCPVFCELDMTTDERMEQVMDAFQNAARTEEGALLLALDRGKIYMNWDLNYESVLGVVHVSIPFGPWHTNDTIVAKRKYLERKYHEVNCLENKGWYHKAAFRTLNQSYSCSLQNERHERGVIIVLDSRMHGERHEFEDYIPQWVLHPVEPIFYNQFESLINSVHRKLKHWSIVEDN